MLKHCCFKNIFLTCLEFLPDPDDSQSSVWGVQTVPAGEHGGLHGGPGGGHDEQKHGAQVTGHTQDHRGKG